MKLFLVSVLLFSSGLLAGRPPCSDLKFAVNVIQTTDNLDNGKIEVTIIKSTSRVRAFLYGDKKSKNRLNVKIDELKNLAAGNYVLVLQDKKCSTVKKNIIIK